MTSPPPGTLLIDIGTNAELALWNGSRWWVTSAAADPAFDGGNISSGMILEEWTVADARLDGDRICLTVAGHCGARSLCGSGLFSLVSVARQGGLVNETGRILSVDEIETNLGRYLLEQPDSWSICFHRSAARELVLTQADIRNFQLAKRAVRAGVKMLLERGGVAEEKVTQVLVTGSFGSALPVAILKRVALLQEPMLDKTSFIANGVLKGLRMYLTAAHGRQRLSSLMSNLQPFPLSGNLAFERCFLTSLEF